MDSLVSHSLHISSFLLVTFKRWPLLQCYSSFFHGFHVRLQNVHLVWHKCKYHSIHENVLCCNYQIMRWTEIQHKQFIEKSCHRSLSKVTIFKFPISFPMCRVRLFTQFSNELSNACGLLRFARLLQFRSRRQKASASLRRKRRRSTTSKTTRRPTTKMSTRRRPPPQQQLLKDSLKVRAKRLNGWAITVMKKLRPPRPIPRSVDLAKAFAMKRS